MKYAFLMAVIALGALYLFRDAIPPEWRMSEPSSVSRVTGARNLGSAVGNALERAADQF